MKLKKQPNPIELNLNERNCILIIQQLFSIEKTILLVHFPHWIQLQLSYFVINNANPLIINFQYIFYVPIQG